MRILIIQTAFIGDVVLATPVIEKLHKHYPAAQIDFLLRRGNESLLEAHPILRDVLVWDKKRNKYLNLLKMIRTVRRGRYDLVVNLQRFFSTGLVTALSGADQTTGFHSNPLSFLFSERKPHRIGEGIHEVDRNLSLISDITDSEFQIPGLYPTDQDFQTTAVFRAEPFITISPASVWPTKQFPASRWVELLNRLQFEGQVFLLGSHADFPLCEEIRKSTEREKVVNLAGKLSLLSTAALMQKAKMNYTNDSAPLHLASAMNAPVCAVFCSTVPRFGFGPLSANSTIVEVEEDLPCRPCGLHGRKKCPEGHFRCAQGISIDQLIAVS